MRRPRGAYRRHRHPLVLLSVTTRAFLAVTTSTTHHPRGATSAHPGPFHPAMAPLSAVALIESSSSPVKAPKNQSHRRNKPGGVPERLPHAQSPPLSELARLRLVQTTQAPWRRSRHPRSRCGESPVGAKAPIFPARPRPRSPRFLNITGSRQKPPRTPTTPNIEKSHPLPSREQVGYSVGEGGLEPPRPKRTLAPEASASANSATRPNQVAALATS